MHEITIVGLGPGDPRFLTLEALNHLKKADRLILRTQKHPTVDYLKEEGIGFTTCDDLYESAETFEEVYEGIVNHLIESAGEGPVTYAVPGNPFVAERTVELLQERVEALRFVYGVSFIDAVLTLIRKDPVEGLHIVDALDPGRIHNQTTNMVIQVYNQMVAADVKWHLAGLYPDDHVIHVVQAAGVQGVEKVTRRALSELDRHDDYDHLTSLVIPPVEADQRRMDFEDLVGIMKTLRGENGCPWDRKQTHESLKRHLIEEAYEVIEAIDEGDSGHLEEELGDLMLQIVFHGLIEEESGYFDLTDVTDGISRKLLRRHPHVFGDATAANAEEVESIWASVKAEEKEDGHSERMAAQSKAFPALIRAAKVQKIAREVGFDWDDVHPAMEKVSEEFGELQEEIRRTDMERTESELGDLLFAVVNVARLLKIDPEIALDQTIQKFINRFRYIEASPAARDRGLEALSLEEMDRIWEESKTIGKTNKKT